MWAQTTVVSREEILIRVWKNPLIIIFFFMRRSATRWKEEGMTEVVILPALCPGFSKFL